MWKDFPFKLLHQRKMINYEKLVYFEIICNHVRSFWNVVYSQSHIVSLAWVFFFSFNEYAEHRFWLVSIKLTMMVSQSPLDPVCALLMHFSSGGSLWNEIKSKELLILIILHWENQWNKKLHPVHRNFEMFIKCFKQPIEHGFCTRHSLKRPCCDVRTSLPV